MTLKQQEPDWKESQGSRTEDVRHVVLSERWGRSAKMAEIACGCCWRERERDEERNVSVILSTSQLDKGVDVTGIH